MPPFSALTQTLTNIRRRNQLKISRQGKRQNPSGVLGLRLVFPAPGRNQHAVALHHSVKEVWLPVITAGNPMGRIRPADKSDLSVGAINLFRLGSDLGKQPAPGQRHAQTIFRPGHFQQQLNPLVKRRLGVGLVRKFTGQNE